MKLGMKFYESPPHMLNWKDCPTIAFDVDQTLVMWDDTALHPGPGKKPFNNNGRVVYLKPHNKHVFYLKTYRARGYKVIVWSAAGGGWAEQVVKGLELEPYVDLMMSKLNGYYDDLPADEILGQHLYFHNDLDGERWAPVKGFEKSYEVSDYGRVRRLNKFGDRQIKELGFSTHGYVTVQLKSSKVVSQVVHRLVAQAFLDNPNNYEVVNHINGNRQDNNVWNLEWVTTAQNVQRKTKKARKSTQNGAMNGSAKLSEADVVYIYNALKAGQKIKQLSEKYNVTKTTISYIRDKKAWKYLTDRLD